MVKWALGMTINLGEHKRTVNNFRPKKTQQAVSESGLHIGFKTSVIYCCITVQTRWSGFQEIQTNPKREIFMR